MILQGYRSRAALVAASATTVQFSASTNLARIPIILAKDARIAILTTLPTAVTISGGAGTKYVYADLAAPSGDPWSTYIASLTAAPPFNKANLATLFRLLFPDDATIAYAAQDSGATLVMSATAPDSESTTGRLPLGFVLWDGAAIVSVTSYGGVAEQSSLATSQVPRAYLVGLGLSNNAGDASNDIDIAAGVCRDSTDVDTIRLSAITKRLDAAWAVGTGNGGIDTGAEAANTWYHVWAIKRSDTGVSDALFSTSATAPTMPASYDLKRRIGAVRNGAGSAILAFTQVGDQVLWTTPILDLSADLTEAATNRTLTVPLGVSVDAIVNVGADFTAGNQLLYVYSPAQADGTPSLSAAPLASLLIDTAATGAVTGPLRIRTNTASQIRTATTGVLDGNGISIATLGYLDRRGRDD